MSICSEKIIFKRLISILKRKSDELLSHLDFTEVLVRAGSHESAPRTVNEFSIT